MRKSFGDPDALLTAVEHRSRAEARRRREEAEEEADEICRSARVEARTLQKEILEDARGRREREERRRRAEGEAEIRKIRLEAREEPLEAVWEAARERLRELIGDSGSYVDVLESLALEAAGLLPVEEIRLASDPRGHDLLTEERLEEWSRRAQEALDRSVAFRRGPDPAEVEGGLVATDSEGRTRVDASFEARLHAARETLRDEILDILEAES